MDLSLDIKLQIVGYLPRYIQHQLISDSILGVACCNEVFKNIKIVPTSSRIICIDYDERLHKLNCIKELDPIGFEEEEMIEVPHYGQLKSKFPYTPNKITFDTLSELVDFYNVYGDDVFKFKSIRILSVESSGKFDLPPLNNIKEVVLGHFEQTDTKFQKMFSTVETMNCEYSSFPNVPLPKLYSLKTADLLDYSSYFLESLWYTDGGGTNGRLSIEFFPRTLKHLTITSNQSSVSDLDLSRFQLETLVIHANDSWDIGKCMSEGKLPQTLQKLDLGSLGGNFRASKSRNCKLNLTNLKELILKDMPLEALFSICSPNLQRLELRHLSDTIAELQYEQLTSLTLDSIRMPRDFVFPRSLTKLVLLNPPFKDIDISYLENLSSLDFKSMNKARLIPSENLEWFIGSRFEPFVCPKKLISLDMIIDKYSQMEFNDSLKDAKIKLEGPGVDLNELVRQLPKNLLALSVVNTTKTEGNTAELVDLTRFTDLVALELNGLNLSDDLVKFPPQLVKLDLYENDFKDIPQLSELTLLSIVSNSLVCSGLQVPPRLKFLDLINNCPEQEMNLDFTATSLEYLNIASWITPRSLILPRTLKVLYLDCDTDDLDWVDANLCEQLTVVYQ